MEFWSRFEFQGVVLLDTFHRYSFPYNEIIAKMDAFKKTSILDVGSNGIGFGYYLEGVDCKLTLLDVKPFGRDIIDKHKNFDFVSYDGQKFPFADKQFDYVVSVDVLEHINKENRSPFIQELIRVSKTKVILVFPEGKYSVWAEKLLSLVYFRKNMFLLEHEKLGLPTSREVKDCLEKSNYNDYKVKDSLNLSFWLEIMVLSSILLRLLPSMNSCLFHFYRRYIFHLLNFKPGYGKCFIINLEDQ